MRTDADELPAGVLDALAGDDLAGGIGRTFLVAAVSTDGWPMIATLSVGEVYAPDAHTVLLSLYATSRTTAAIRSSGRAVLLVVDGGAIVRVRLEPTEVPGVAEGRATFRATVAAVETDAVPYATVRNGIEYDLLDPDAVLTRWQTQLDELRGVAS